MTPRTMYVLEPGSDGRPSKWYWRDDETRTIYRSNRSTSRTIVRTEPATATAEHDLAPRLEALGIHLRPAQRP